MIRSKRARLFVENFGARLAGIVIWSDCPLFEKMSRGAQIDKIWLNWQYTCSKNPGASFFWGRRSAAGSDHQTHRAGDHNLVSKQCQRKTLSKNSGAKPCQRNILSKSYILTVSDGIFWVSPIYLLYLMECFKLKGKGRVTGKGLCNRKRCMYVQQHGGVKPLKVSIISQQSRFWTLGWV